MSLFHVATNFGKGDSRETDWFHVVTFDKLAEQCNIRLHQGSLVYVEGRLKTRRFRDDDGNEKSTVEIIAQNVLFFNDNCRM